MVESNPIHYSTGDGHAEVSWKPIHPMEEGNSFWDALVLIGAAGFIVMFFVGLFWLAAIVEYLLK